MSRDVKFRAVRVKDTTIDVRSHDDHHVVLVVTPTMYLERGRGRDEELIAHQAIVPRALWDAIEDVFSVREDIIKLKERMFVDPGPVPPDADAKWHDQHMRARQHALDYSLIGDIYALWMKVR